MNIKFSNLSMHHNYLDGLLKHRLLGLSFRVFDLIGLKLEPSICISNKFPIYIAAAGLRALKKPPWKITGLKENTIDINQDIRTTRNII